MYTGNLSVPRLRLQSVSIVSLLGILEIQSGGRYVMSSMPTAFISSVPKVPKSSHASCARRETWRCARVAWRIAGSAVRFVSVASTQYSHSQYATLSSFVRML